MVNTFPIREVPRAPRRIADTLQRLRSEYLDMPRLSLTPGQVAQILSVEPPTARSLLHARRVALLEGTRDGRFARVVPRPELHDCVLCGQGRIHGSPLRVADADEAEALLGVRGLPSQTDLPDR